MVKAKSDELYNLIKETRDMVHALKENDIPALKLNQQSIEQQVKFTNGKVRFHTKIFIGIGSIIGTTIVVAILRTIIVGG
jgi:hypothetical protein